MSTSRSSMRNIVSQLQIHKECIMITASQPPDFKKIMKILSHNLTPAVYSLPKIPHMTTLLTIRVSAKTISEIAVF